MYNIEVNLSLDPVCEYEKAKKNLIQAGVSISKLTEQEQERLIREVFGDEKVNYVIGFSQLIGRG